MSDVRPILILTASAGAGHTVAAWALHEAFGRLAPQLPVEVHDVLQSTNVFFRTLYAQGYLGLVNHAPNAMGWLYEATDRGNGQIRAGLRARFQDLNMGRAVRHVLRRDPRLIVNTHFLPAETIARQRRRGRLSVPQVTVTTDFDTHRLWVQPPTERYYTATEEGKAYLGTWGVPVEDIRVTGIPIRAAFRQEMARNAACQACGLEGEGPVVLLLCGGFGVGPAALYLRELLTLPPDVQPVVICGRNEPLCQRLEALAAHSGRAARVIGFTDRMHEWMRAADLVVTKPGGLTASEALACRLPLVVVNPIPGQETRNSDFLLEKGAAIKVNNPRMLAHRVRDLLDQPQRCRQLSEAAQRLARPAAAAAIVGDILSLPCMIARRS